MLSSPYRLAALLFLSGLLLIQSTQSIALDDGRLGLFDARISPDGARAAFTWSGDIWVADLATGDAYRLTANVAWDHSPAWFPNGSRIAFSSNRDGNDDVYSVPSAGGEPSRHTWQGGEDTVMDVAPDGEHILFRGKREIHSFDIYEVDTHGGLERALTNDTSRNFEARYSPDGASIVVSRGIFDWTRRAYNGSGDTDLYVMDRDGSNMRWVENGYDGIDYWPAWAPDASICFVSDRDGCENVYMRPISGQPALMLTAYTDRPVQFLSISRTGRALFVQDFRLRTFDLPRPGERYAGIQPDTIDLKCASESNHSQEIRLDMDNAITEMELSPTGSHLALIARGELFIVPLHDPETTVPVGDARWWDAVRITESPTREQSVNWHPSGDRVVITSDKDRNQEIYEINLRTNEWTRITDTSEDEWAPKYSHDGSKIAFIRGNAYLYVKNLETGREFQVTHDLFVFPPYVGQIAWSPDDTYLAWTGNDIAFHGEVCIASIDKDGRAGELVNLTRHPDQDDFAGWAADCRSIYFMSGRNSEYGLESYGSWNRGNVLFTLPLRNQPAPRNDVLTFPGDVAPDDPQRSTVVLDLDRISERAIAVSPTRGGGGRAALSPDCKTYLYESNALGGSALWSLPFGGGSATRIADTPGRIDDIEWLPDSKGAIYLTNGRPYAWLKKSGAIIPVPTNGRLTIDLAAERREMIYEAGRMLKNHFYDPQMHNRNWDEAIDLYAPLVEEASTPEEFHLLMMELLGELDASHLGCYGPGSNEGIGADVAELGLEFDPNTSGPGLLVTYVLPRGPADFPDLGIKAGEWVLKIDGTDVSPRMNYWSLLDDLFARTTVLSVASDQSGRDAREVAIGPVRHDWGDPRHLPWSAAEYKAWVDQVKAYVNEKSGGRIGYVHIQYMGGGPLEDFARELFTEDTNKDALIMDIRWNGGGNIHEYLIDILSRPQFAWSRPRDGNTVQQPAHRWGRPTVLMINERSTSDSEIFPEAFRELHLGTIIGEPTPGAVIGTDEFRLVDGQTGLRLPMEGWFALDYRNLENTGVQPDIRVVNDLNDIRNGIDDQLDASIEYLLKEIQ